MKELENIFKLSKRMIQYLQKVIEFPDVVKEALVQEKMDLTHAIVLMQAKEKMPEIDVVEEVKRFDEQKISVSALKQIFSDRKVAVDKKTMFVVENGEIKFVRSKFKFDMDKQEKVEGLLKELRELIEG
jgi:hypothetical protein